MSIGPIVRDLTAPGHAPGVASPPPSRTALPRAGWPAKGDLDYVKVAIEVALLLLALPWLLHRVLTKPASTAKRAGEGKLSG